MNRDEAIDTIIRATQWLLISPDTHTGFVDDSGHYTIEVSAVTNGYCVGSNGVYFGGLFVFDRRRDLLISSDVIIIDHADRKSWYDYVSILRSPRRGEGASIGPNGDYAVNTRSLKQFPDEQIIRMARNVMRIMEKYEQI
jgi:hypothetical protein